MRLVRKILWFCVCILCLSMFYGCARSKRVEIKKEKIGNVELAYYTRGSGEPLVMIMGFRGTMAMWDPGLLDILEKNHTLILFDNRGAGLSSDSQEEEMTIPRMAEDTVNLIKAIGFQKAHFLGWSMGSRIALEVAIHHPEIVETLILCSPNPGGTRQAPRKSNAYEQLLSKNLSKKEALSVIFPDTPIGRDASDAFVARLTEAVIRGTVPNDLNISDQTVERQVNALKLWDQNNEVYEALSTINAPALAAGGLADALDQPENVQTIAARIPFAWSAYFAGAGHNFPSQDYKNFADLVNVFIESNKNNRLKNKEK